MSKFVDAYKLLKVKKFAEDIGFSPMSIGDPKLYVLIVTKKKITSVTTDEVGKELKIQWETE